MKKYTDKLRKALKFILSVAPEVNDRYVLTGMQYQHLCGSLMEEGGCWDKGINFLQIDNIKITPKTVTIKGGYDLIPHPDYRWLHKMYWFNIRVVIPNRKVEVTK